MIKMFEDFNEIHAICKKYKIKKYSINTDGSIDVKGSVYLKSKKLTKLPLKFGRVSGDFSCRVNKLTSLDGAPSYVGAHFSCSDNELTSLEGCPKYVGGDFDCSNNFLTSLEFCPGFVGYEFHCDHNEITSLKFAPTKVNGLFFFYKNPLQATLFDNKDNISYILANQDDYGIWRADGSLNEPRFDIMMRDMLHDDKRKRYIRDDKVI